MRYEFDTYGLSPVNREAVQQFGWWRIEGGEWGHASLSSAILYREHLKNCGKTVGKIYREYPPAKTARVSV